MLSIQLSPWPNTQSRHGLILLLLFSLGYQLFSYSRQIWQQIDFVADQIHIRQAQTSFQAIPRDNTLVTQWLVVLQLTREDGKKITQLIFFDAMSEADFHQLKLHLKNVI